MITYFPRLFDFNVKKYGAIGNGVANDRAAIQRAIDAASVGGGIVHFPRGTYVIDNTLDITASNVQLRGEPPAKIVMTGDANAIEFDGSLPSLATTTLSASLIQNNSTLSVTSATGITAGKLLRLASDSQWHYGAAGIFKGELHLVEAVDGSTVRLSHETQDNYDLDSEAVEVTARNTIDGAAVEDLEIEFSPARLRVGLYMAWCVKPKVNRVTVKNAQTSGIYTVYCYQSKITNCDLEKANQATLGYGVSVNAGVFDTVENCSFLNCRRGVDFSGVYPARMGLVSNCSVSGSGLDHLGNALASSGFGTHESSTSCQFIGNRTSGVTVGYVMRGSDHALIGNVSNGNLTFASFTEGGDLFIHNNVMSDNIGPGTATSVVGSSNIRNWVGQDFLLVSGSMHANSRVFLSGNTARGLRRSFVRLASNLNILDMRGNFISLIATSGANAVNVINAASAVTISQLSDSGNTVLAPTGTYSRINANVTSTPIPADPL